MNYYRRYDDGEIVSMSNPNYGPADYVNPVYKGK